MKGACLKVKWILSVLSLFLTLGGFSQEEITDVILPGTNIKISLPSNFVNTTDNHEVIAGFLDTNDSTIIYAAQVIMEDPFESLISQQKESLERFGHSITEIERFDFKGSQGAIIEYSVSDSSVDGMAFIFKSAAFQNFIMTTYPKNRKDEIHEILLTSSIDTSVDLEDTHTLGFKTEDTIGPFTIVMNNSLMLHYEALDDSDELVADFKMGKIPKESFGGFTSYTCLEMLSQQYFPNQIAAKEGENDLIVDAFGYYRVYKNLNENGEIQFSYITVLRFVEFDVMCMGFSNTLSHIDYMENIIRSIQLD